MSETELLRKDDFSEMLPKYLQFDPVKDKEEILEIEERDRVATEYVLRLSTGQKPDVQCHADKNDLIKAGESLKSVVRLIDGLDSAIGRKVIENLREYQESTGRNIQEVIEFVERLNLHRPKFTLMSYEEAVPFCQENELVKPDPSSLTLIFNLPKPVAVYWEKGKGDWGDRGIEVNNLVIPWGTIYRKVAPIIWNEIDRRDLNIIRWRRLNTPGQHDKFKYYYVWQFDTSTSIGEEQEETSLSESEEAQFRRISGSDRKDPFRDYEQRGGKQDHGTKTTPMARKAKKVDSGEIPVYHINGRAVKELNKQRGNTMRRREDKVASLQGLLDRDEEID